MILLLPTMLLPPMLLLRFPTMPPTPILPIPTRRRRHTSHRLPRQININPPLILLSLILQSQLPTNLLHPRFDLLNMVCTMIPFAHNNMQMTLSLLLRRPDPRLKNMFRFFYELAVQVYCVAGDAVGGVVLAEYVV